ncbi:coiled-coil domain-containing protein 137-like [Homalodisca vitripennis]|uniref:coiled-coil domain-containing protein 137-like n=1 Tax=Homalodisca vitripennis TaxID=197043 RepID=UPI001EECEFBF|nr:coiled-coil domain-containing protein 137-like [Homalodisca vitripennis]XP_046680448.1 coiled-coil domain-containing protein 137-like [Homalodisca vitripennis]KAG8330331.1 hypothetical protein J6590_066469 [Homalodisca vitripennis]
MGRRIPGKKHKGVKDPIAQKELREEALKHCINAPPKDIDVQEIPKSLERLIKLKQMTKEGMFNKVKKKNKKKNTNLMDTSKLAVKEKVLPGMTRPDRELPVLVQKRGEPDKVFLNRVRLATNSFIKEVNFEVKHNMKMKRDKKTGEVTFEKVELDPIEKMFQKKILATEKRKHKKNRKDVAEQEGLSKTARRRMKLQARRAEQELPEKEVTREDDFSKLQDKVEFNEVVHRPPQLTALPRKAVAADSARRPGSKPGLLLTQILASSGRSNRELSGRRRDLSASDRRRLDSAQTDAIQAYRQMKAARATAAVR